MHEDTSQIKLHLETYIHIGSIDSGRPPKRKPSIRDLIESRALSMRQFFKLHRLFEPRGFLPKETLPSGEVSPFKQSVLKNALHTS